jgi:hypothetical protein
MLSPAPTQTAPPSVLSTESPASAVEAPVETPQAPITDTPRIPSEEPAKTQEAASVEAPAELEAKAEEKPAESKDEEPDYVLASDYEKLHAELEALKSGKPADAVEEPAKSEEATTVDPPAKEPIDLSKVEPELLFDPEEIADDVYDALGIEAKTPEGAPLRAAVAKQFSMVAHKASEHAYARAKAEFKMGMTSDIAKQVAVHYHTQRVADKVLEDHPELSEPKSFLKLATAIGEAADNAQPGTTANDLAADAYRRYQEAGGIVQRFKSQGGKIIKPNGAAPGTAPQQRAGAPAPETKAQVDPRKVPSVLGL